MLCILSRRSYSKLFFLIVTIMTLSHSSVGLSNNMPLTQMGKVVPNITERFKSHFEAYPDDEAGFGPFENLGMYTLSIGAPLYIVAQGFHDFEPVKSLIAGPVLATYFFPIGIVAGLVAGKIIKNAVLTSTFLVKELTNASRESWKSTFSRSKPIDL